MGMLTEMIPAMVSLTPQEFIVNAEGCATKVMTIRMMAAVMTKMTEESRSINATFFLNET
jgi:hypothetical protein